MATSKQPKDKSGKMHIRQQRSLLSGFHINSRRNQTGQEQTQGDPDGQGPGRHQNDQILCGIVQFLPDAHQGFCSDSCSTVQAYSKVFRIQRGSVTTNSDGRIYQPQKTANFRTGNGIPQDRRAVCPDHGCCHRYGRYTRRTLSNTYPGGQRWQVLRHLICIQTVKGP